MKVLFLVMAFWMVLARAKALDIVVTDDISCEELPVSMSVTWLCNEESVCTCGDEVSVQGKMIYNGLEETFGASEYDSLYVNASFEFSTSRFTTTSQHVLDMFDVPVCGQDDDCPADGEYAFEYNFTYPEPTNDSIGLTTDGLQAEIVIEIYFNDTATLVGMCTMGVRTQQSDSSHDSMRSIFEQHPSARYGGFIALVLLVITVFYCVARFCYSREKQRKKEPLILPEEKNVEREQRKPRFRTFLKGAKMDKMSCEGTCKRVEHGIFIVSSDERTPGSEEECRLKNKATSDEPLSVNVPKVSENRRLLSAEDSGCNAGDQIGSS